jgi:hypothetical protein
LGFFNHSLVDVSVTSNTWVSLLRCTLAFTVKAAMLETPNAKPHHYPEKLITDDN